MRSESFMVAGLHDSQHLEFCSKPDEGYVLSCVFVCACFSSMINKYRLLTSLSLVLWSCISPYKNQESMYYSGTLVFHIQGLKVILFSSSSYISDRCSKALNKRELWEWPRCWEWVLRVKRIFVVICNATRPSLLLKYSVFKGAVSIVQNWPYIEDLRPVHTASTICYMRLYYMSVTCQNNDLGPFWIAKYSP